MSSSGARVRYQFPHFFIILFLLLFYFCSSVGGILHSFFLLWSVALNSTLYFVDWVLVSVIGVRLLRKRVGKSWLLRYFDIWLSCWKSLKALDKSQTNANKFSLPHISFAVNWAVIISRRFMFIMLTKSKIDSYQLCLLSHVKTHRRLSLHSISFLI